ncbi:MerR family transcriptional regulator [Hoeflea prorocentri]|uniref:MerR family transcriptional regulator n=1 Tax=Hoeflea prorocentri TaxID=1922333 RepID=A0A9X3ZHI1_9HYPH|nr:MerR family transcriptional regulator [Hoeflea prorocentri]MCY6380953.1 MerR family transcriptional regulator [Hoeflea prorocentri]MDA5398753.1 MerR family transcriptional regulator [Hoeflea prorocentri]
MRIGEVARRSGLSRDTIRFYERNGLIASGASQDSTNSYRVFEEEIFERLRMIDEAQKAGFTISELRFFLRQIERPVDQEFDMDEFLSRKIQEVEVNIERANRFLETLRATRDALAGKT